MGLIEWLVVIYISVVVLSLIFAAFYSRLKLKLERSKVSRQLYKKEQTEENPYSQKKIVRLWHLLDGYMYGYVRYILIRVGKVPSYHIRNWLYRYVFCMSLTKKTVIYSECEIRSPWNIQIGRSTIARGCVLDGRNGIEIGDDVCFGSFVHVWTEQHDKNAIDFKCSDGDEKVVIHDHAWICSDTTILPGIHIGEGAVIAARACLTKDADEFGIYAGVPAKKIGERNQNLQYKLGEIHWHFY